MNLPPEYDPLDTPPPPPTWRWLLPILVFVGVVIAFALAQTSCACHYDGTSLDCALDGEQAAKAIIVLSEK